MSTAEIYAFYKAQQEANQCKCGKCQEKDKDCPHTYWIRDAIQQAPNGIAFVCEQCDSRILVQPKRPKQTRYTWTGSEMIPVKESE